MISTTSIYKKSIIVLICFSLVIFLAGCIGSSDTEAGNGTANEIENGTENGIENGTEIENNYPQPEGILEYHDILVVPPAFFRENNNVDAEELAEIELMLQNAQNYFNNTRLDLSLPTIYFVPMVGVYTYDDQSMLVVGTFVNRYDRPIISLSAIINLQVGLVEGMEIEPMSISLHPEFLGVLQPNEALLITLQMSATGLDEDRFFEAFHFSSGLTNIRVVELSDTEETNDVEETEETEETEE